MSFNPNQLWIMKDLDDTEEEGPNYFLVGGPNPAYCRPVRSLQNNNEKPYPHSQHGQVGVLKEVLI